MKRFQRILTAVIALCLVLSILPLGASAALAMGTKPSDGTTSGEPFPQGTGGSNSFRIPALVTLSDGTLVAAADARWNTTYDGGGLDTIVARSTDNGASWNYTFANYLGDNGNVYNGSSSTAFIDPALAVTDNDTIYMLVDLYPYGVALNGSGQTAPSTSVGFNSEGKLLLSYNNSTSYNYYLDNGKIYSSDGTEQAGYTVDAYFNLTGNGYNTNLFFSDSPFKVVRTGYLYLTKSTDKGETWSAPQLLNLKKSSEQVCLVAPGRGLVTDNGTIIFPVYSYHGDNDPSGNTQRMSFIYSTDGINWSRTSELNHNWASESAVVELSDGTLRFFFRNGTTNLCYVDYANNTWGTPVTMTNIHTNSNCQLSAITYSRTIDGEQVILVSCPTGPNSAGSDQSGASYRLNGKIFAFTVGDNNTLTKVGEIPVTANENQFMYSCLTELSDGSVGILYEDGELGWGAGDGKYYTMSYQTFDLTQDVGLTFDEKNDTEDQVIQGIYEGSALTDIQTLTVNGPNKNLTFRGLNDGQSLTISGYDESFVTISITGNAITLIPVAEGHTIATFTVLDSTGTAIGTYNLDITVNKEITGEDTISSTSQDTESVVYVLKTNGNIDPTKPYLIVNTGSDGTGYALTNDDGKTGKTEVTIQNGQITVSDDSKISWTFSGRQNGFIKNNGLYVIPQNQSLALLTSTNQSLTFASDGNGAYRLYYSQREQSYGNNYRYYYYLYYYNIGERWNGIRLPSRNTSYIVYLYEQTTTSSNTTVWNIDPQRQTNRIAAYTTPNVGYTTTSWNAYQDAKNAAEAKLAEVKAATYTSEAAAETARAELIALVDAMEAARNALAVPVTLTIHYQENGVTVKTETIQIAASAVTHALPTTVLGSNGSTYKVDNTTLTLTAGVNTYNVPVSKLEGYQVTVKEKELLTVSPADPYGDGSVTGIELEEGQYIQWSTSDASYAGVAGKYDPNTNALTASAVIAGQAVTVTPVTVTGTIYNSDGSVAGIYHWLVTVTAGDADTNTESRHIYVNVTECLNSTAYYSINGGPLVAINGTGVVIDEDTTGHFNIMFFAVPNDGYALTYMSVSGSAKEYFSITDGNPDGTGSQAWPFDDVSQSTIPTTSNDSAWKEISNGTTTTLHGMRWPLFEGNFNIEQYKLVLSNAIALGATGMVSFTKNGTDSFYTHLEFVSQELATMEKSIHTIMHADGTTELYTDGMEIVIGDTIIYEIIITDPAEPQGELYSDNSYSSTSPITDGNQPEYTIGSYGTIEYTNVTLTDKLTGSVFYSDVTDAIKESNPTTFSMSSSDEEDQVYTLYTKISLQASNFLSVVQDGRIRNTAELSYSFSSEYTDGSLETEASAVAEINVVVPEYVIDFGLPVDMDLTADPLVDGDIITAATAKYGTVTITADRSFTYTPTGVLTDSDFITLTFKEDISQAIIGYGVRVYPATTIYYEEGFAAYTGSWSGQLRPPYSDKQVSARPNQNDTYLYGFDPVYSNDSQASNGTQAVSSAFGDTAEFTFTGTGVEIYGNCDPNTDRMVVLIKDSSGKLVRFYQVHTNTGGGGDVTAPQNQLTNAYSLPVVSVLDLPHGSYTVTINHGRVGSPSTDADPTNGLRIDGFRVHGTLDPASAPYISDGEANPQFLQLRDEVLYLAEAPDNADGSQYIPVSDTGKAIVDQVYSAAGTTTGAVYMSSGAYRYNDLKDLLDNGPKNELYLYSQNDSITFTLDSSVTAAQIGLKAVNGQTGYSISVNGSNVTSADLNTCTDMFYELNLTSGQDNTVVITNTGSSILSITLLKYFTGGEATPALAALTAEDMSVALYAMGYEDVQAPVQPEKVSPFTDVGVNSHFFDAILWAYENNITKGKTDTTFAPESNVTRAQFVTLLWRAAGEPEPTLQESSFTDVPNGKYYTKAVLWAVEKGITIGTTKESFSPDAYCTRSQVVMFLYRYAGKPDVSDVTNPFTDVTESNRFYDAILWAYREGITLGKTKTTFAVESLCTRAQVVAFLYRFLG